MASAIPTSPVPNPTIEAQRSSAGEFVVRLAGDWGQAGPDAIARLGQIETELRQAAAENVSAIILSGAELARWDSQVLVWIKKVSGLAKQHSIPLDLTALPKGIPTLLRLSNAVPPREAHGEPVARDRILALIGKAAISWAESVHYLNCFLGQTMLSLWRFIRGEARFLRSDVITYMQEAGPQALPIVAIINILLGIILAFMGAVQLQQFGAQIYVADLVGLGLTREIAPMMTAIVIAGRTGAAYAAQLGTMQVNEEIDALRTFGFAPMDFLVLPRMLALALMFPMLVLYADAMGIFGGYLVGVVVLDLSSAEYLEQTREALSMGDVVLGLVKGSVFGVLVAVTGCMHGMQSGRSASAVGDATTKAVVSGIIAIIVTTAVFAVLTNFLGI